MSVLVKGMKMPKGCYECPLTDGEYGDCKVGATGEYDPYRKGCPLDEPKTGGWVLKQDREYYCSCCGEESGLDETDVFVYGMKLPDYCSHCGARMERL